MPASLVAEPPSNPTQAVAVANRLRPVLLHLARHLRREPLAAQVSAGQVEILALVSGRPGIGINELASMVGISPPAMSNAIDKLEAARLVSRSRVSPGDRRRVGVTVSAEGSRIVRAARSSRTAWLAERLGRLSQEQLAAVEAAIDALEALVRQEPAG